MEQVITLPGEVERWVHYGTEYIKADDYAAMAEHAAIVEMRVAELEFALRTLRDAADTSDDARYGTLGTGFVRHVVDGALRLPVNESAQCFSTEGDKR